MRDGREAQVLDTGQTGTRERLHNSCVDSYSPAIYDWAAFMSTEVKLAEECVEGGGQREGKGLKENPSSPIRTI